MLLASASVVGAVIYMLSISCVHQRQETARIRARLTVLTIWMMGIVVWPVLWAGIFKEERFDLMSKLSLLWPILIIGTDITAMHQMTYEAAHTHSKRQMLSIDSNAICSLTFALSRLDWRTQTPMLQQDLSPGRPRLYRLHTARAICQHNREGGHDDRNLSEDHSLVRNRALDRWNHAGHEWKGHHRPSPRVAVVDPLV